MYPVLHLVGQALIAAALGALLGWGLSQIHPLLALLGAVPAYAFLVLAKRYDHHILAHYLMHDFAFSAQYWGAYPPALSARMAQFAARIRAAMDGPYDEVLVVGHSSGAYMGVSILADILRDGLPDNRPALGFLTLGQVVPMVSFLPRARRLRGDLHHLCQREDITWVDVTAPGDGCAFALCDPVQVTGLAPPAQKWPLIVSCAFTQTLSPQTWARLKRRFFRLHFQYMCAFDRVGHYDYFRITAGAQTLAQRYAGHYPFATAHHAGAVVLPRYIMTLPPKPTPRPDRVSLWRYLRLFRADILSAQPQRLYRAWMAEFRTLFFRSYMINDPALIARVLTEAPALFPNQTASARGWNHSWEIRCF